MREWTLSKTDHQAVRNFLAHELSFSEERLASFKKIQQAFVRLIGTTGLEMEAAGLPDRGVDFYVDGYAVEYKRYQQPGGWLHEAFEFEIVEDKPCRDPEAAETQIAAFETFYQSRIQHGHAVGEKEQKLIGRIRQAIDHYNEYASAYFYRQFRHALQAYFNWLNKKLYQQELYVVHLYRLRAAIGILVDGRSRLRSILRFRCRTLSDEDGLTLKLFLSFKQVFYRISSHYHGHQQYQTSISRYQRGTGFQGLATGGS